MKSAEVRQTFLDFFEQRGHTVVPSSPVISNDPTLLFVNAGMVPFKDVFLGKEQRSYTRATSAQKCMRVSGKHNDLEEVGPSPQHHTFFEMLGNFSFGDYFKEEALPFYWELLTKEYDLPADRLHPTVYEEDDESAQIWSKLTGRPPDKIVRLGADENFWSMGETGPCGPNSEVIFDRTGKCLRDGSACFLTCDCNRWWELGNNVFIQYDRAADGTLTPLPKAGVDTGMGFERMCAVLQDVPSNYETDVFTPLFEEITSITNVGYEEASDEQKIAMRVLADHARALSFLIADGIMPSNEGRGYVLRRVLRRASYHGRLLGLEEPFLSKICSVVIDEMGSVYPELREAHDLITTLVADEEERFLATLESGLNRLNQIIQPSGIASEEAFGEAKVLSGEDAFRLYDTFGFPLDLTRKALEDKGWTVDEAGFDSALDEQRRRGREARAKEQDEALMAAVRDLEATSFIGYESLTSEANISLLFAGGSAVDGVAEGDEVELVLSTTPFYTEGGGQVGDCGRLVGPEGEIEIDAVRTLGGVSIHSGRVTSGSVASGASVSAQVDEDARRATMRNHTATHLMHRALRVVLGDQAKQAGSLVAPDRLRFDFLHGKPLTDDELRETERLVREQIVLNLPVQTNVMPLQDALDMNADAMFDEKYGEEARVVSVGPAESNAEPFSRELCGGTHCHATGEIGAFFIVEQHSVGAGVRRVEAVTGLNAFRWADEQRRVVDQLTHEYNVPVAELPARLQALQERAKEAPRQAAADLPDPDEVIARARAQLSAAAKVEPKGQVIKPGGIQSEEAFGVPTLHIVDRVDAGDPDVLRAFGDQLRNRAKSAAVILGAVFDGKPSIIIMLTPDQVEAGYHAGKLAKALGKEMGAGGGGRPDVATAGGREPESLDAALAKAKDLLLQQV
ncbi:MAG: alanine--tRNA ligase [Chloroflexi bacterium]|nr:alanine--tRNA ligase [Chloroflexota bacterium]